VNGCVILAFTADDRWHAGIGDPTVMGWLTVAAYFVAAFLCGRAALASKRNQRSRDAVFWCLFTCFLLLLGFNKQLDLQTWFTLLGKHLAEEEGWYAQRRKFQAAFVALIAIVGVVGLIASWRLASKTVRHSRLALLGGIFLGCFILIRAASFHYVDQMLGLRFNNVTFNCMLELGGITCVAIAAWRSCRILLLANALANKV